MSEHDNNQIKSKPKNMEAFELMKELSEAIAGGKAKHDAHLYYIIGSNRLRPVQSIRVQEINGKKAIILD